MGDTVLADDDAFAEALAEAVALAGGDAVCALALSVTAGPNTKPSAKPPARAAVVTNDFRCMINLLYVACLSVVPSLVGLPTMTVCFHTA